MRKQHISNSLAECQAPRIPNNQEKELLSNFTESNFSWKQLSHFHNEGGSVYV